MSMTLTKTQQADTTIVGVTGEVDVSNAAELRNMLSTCLAFGPQTLEVNLSGASYIDSTGIGVLVGTANRASEQGVSFAVVSPQRNVARVLALLGVDEQLGVRL